MIRVPLELIELAHEQAVAEPDTRLYLVGSFAEYACYYTGTAPKDLDLLFIGSKHQFREFEEKFSASARENDGTVTRTKFGGLRVLGCDGSTTDLFRYDDLGAYLIRADKGRRLALDLVSGVVVSPLPQPVDEVVVLRATDSTGAEYTLKHSAPFNQHPETLKQAVIASAPARFVNTGKLAGTETVEIVVDGQVRHEVGIVIPPPAAFAAKKPEPPSVPPPPPVAPEKVRWWACTDVDNVAKVKNTKNLVDLLLDSGKQPARGGDLRIITTTGGKESVIPAAAVEPFVTLCEILVDGNKPTTFMYRIDKVPFTWTQVAFDAEKHTTIPPGVNVTLVLKDGAGKEKNRSAFQKPLPAKIEYRAWTKYADPYSYVTFSAAEGSTYEQIKELGRQALVKAGKSPGFDSIDLALVNPPAPGKTAPAGIYNSRTTAR